jgi:hypothetical protein
MFYWLVVSGAFWMDVVISVNACFLKGPHGGQLHFAIARDANNDIFPIAYVVCEAETREIWT